MKRKKESLEWSRKELPLRGSLKREKKTINVRPLLLVACEGSETEPRYLRSYFDELIEKKVISSRSFVIANHGHTNPSGVLQDLLAHRKDGLTAKDFERKWIFIDRDETRTSDGGGHTKEDFNNALLLADQDNVKVAWSNPCFELWFLLHYEYRETSLDRSDLPGLLTQRLNFKYEKNDSKIYMAIRDFMPTALRNALKLKDRMNKILPCDANPMTTVCDFILENHVATLKVN